MTTAADEPAPSPETHGLSLAPFRALRPTVDNARLATMLCPPYDVIDADLRASLLATDPDNAVAVVLPDQTDEGYAGAGERLRRWVNDGLFAVDPAEQLYVYEMREADGGTTRGLIGAVELRDPADDVILPHENTMAGPVADRLAVMTATDADLEPIYLVYDGGGAASELVRRIGDEAPIAKTTTGDGVTHRLWCVDDAGDHAAVAADLNGRKAMIADGHHRYATYRERQRLSTDERGHGPWDRGLALLVDTSEYGPQVHAIHRAITGLTIVGAVAGLDGLASATEATSQADALAAIESIDGFAVALTDGHRSFVVTDPAGTLAAAASRPGDPPALDGLDVTLVHRGMVERAWTLADDVDTVSYAHTVVDARALARAHDGIAVLLRPTPVSSVAAVAAAGGRMPRKSTLFTPKPASGLVVRRLADQRE
ncbi:MAG: DUF1015 domain-containing protein [Jatrophihabitans sp.]